MPIITEHGPGNKVVLDQMLSSIFESEVFNHHADEYAFEVLHYYFGEFSHDWYHDWIGTEEFRGQQWPDGRKMSKKDLKRYEQMYDLYWDARGEWFALFVAELNIQNIKEESRNMVRHTLTSKVSWKKFGKRMQKAGLIDHQEDDFVGPSVIGS